MKEIEKLRREKEDLKRTQGGAKQEIKEEIQDLVNIEVKKWRTEKKIK